MAIRRRSSSRHVEDLRLTIDCLPIATRVAMLEGVRDAERVIVGAYTDRDGGVCPMLAAHRRGGRTSLLSFARAWDRFTHAGNRARRATRRELSILIGQLEASLVHADHGDLAGAIDEHRQLRRRRLRRVRRLVEGADPPGEILARRLRRAPVSRPPERADAHRSDVSAGCGDGGRSADTARAGSRRAPAGAARS
jgi:hypothetical protein